MVSSVVSRVLGAGSQTVWVCVVKLTLQASSLGWTTLPNSGVLFTPTGSFLEAGTCFLVCVSCCGYIDVVIRACCFVKNTCTHLTVLLYVSHFLCVYCVQFDAESDFA